MNAEKLMAMYHVLPAHKINDLRMDLSQEEKIKFDTLFRDDLKRRSEKLDALIKTVEKSDDPDEAIRIIDNYLLGASAAEKQMISNVGIE